jgi:RNA polymerase sigma factor (sigma-70 family)
VDEENFSRHKNLLELRDVIEDILNEKSGDTFAIRRFIIRLLNQFHLSQYDYQEIVSEVNKRLQLKIKSSEHEYKPISNMPAFIRQTAFNIVREYSRKEKRNRKIERRISDTPEYYLAEETYPASPQVLEKLEKLREAWQNLSLRHRTIVYNKVIKGYTLREIAEEMLIKGLETDCNQKTQNKISRQYHRTIDRLRSQIAGL